MRIIQKLQPLFLALAFLFIILLLRSQWAELSSHTWRLDWRWLLVSAAFLLGAWAVEIQVWRRLLAVVGGRLPYWPAARVWFLSAITRYVPGNIWQPLSITLMCQRRGVPPAATLTSVVFYQILVLLSALPVAALYLGVTGNWGLLTPVLAPWTTVFVVGSLIPLAVYLVRPVVLLDVVNWVLVKLKRLPLAANITRPAAFSVLLLALLDWLLWGSSFAALTFALQEYSTADLLRLAPHLIAAYAIAYTIGLISLLTPSGIGVREGAFYVLLAPLLGGGVITVAALAMRLWTTLGELVAAGISALVRDGAGSAAGPRVGADEDVCAPMPAGPATDPRGGADEDVCAPMPAGPDLPAAQARQDAA